MIGIIGVACDLLLARLGKRLFPWEKSQEKV
jgi:ABC-type nitrate/sulfonate/bicarbonate transport system permease component